MGVQVSRVVKPVVAPVAAKHNRNAATILLKQLFKCARAISSANKRHSFQSLAGLQT